MAQPLHIVVDRGVLLDIGVGLRDICLGLVVVVVGDEVLHRVVRQHLAQLVGQLSGQSLVRRHQQGGPLHLLDQPRRGRRLTGAGGAEQDDILLTAAQPPLQLRYRGGLVTCGLVLADHLEPRLGALDRPDRPELRMRQRLLAGCVLIRGDLRCESHGHQGRRRYRQVPPRRHHRAGTRAIAPRPNRHGHGNRRAMRTRARTRNPANPERRCHPRPHSLRPAHKVRAGPS